jgi:regulator of replication initiation timing
MTKLGKILTTVLAAALCIAIAFSACRISDLKKDLTKANQNLSAVTDTVHELKTKNGKLVSWNQSLIVDKNGLQEKLEQEELNRREIEKRLNSKITSLTKIIAGFSSDTIVLTDTVKIIDDTTHMAPFHYTDDWLTVSGKTLFSGNVSETTISDLRVRVPILIGQTEDMKLFVHTPNPNVNIEMMQNSIVDGVGTMSKKPRWSVGAYAGFGVQYGILNKDIDFGPQLGIGVSYRIF